MSKDLIKGLGARVASLRRSKGMTQVALAKAAGIHVTFLSGVEKGARNITLDTAARLAAPLGVSLADLFSVDRQLGGASAPTPVTFVKLGGTWDMQVTDEGLKGVGQLDDEQFAKLESEVGDESKLVARLDVAFRETKSIAATIGAHLPWVPEMDRLVVGNFYPIFSGDSSHYRPAVMAPAVSYLLSKATSEPGKQIIAGMGTDTVDMLLPYLDTFLFDRPDIHPILISGANLSFREKDSDAPQNFHDLAQATHLPLQPGAYYIFDRTIFKGGDVVKVDPNEHPTSIEGMTTFFAPQRTHARVGVLDTGSIRRENAQEVKGPTLTFSAEEFFNAMNSVLTVNLGDLPDVAAVTERMMDPSVRAIVVVSHALGNVPYPVRRAAIKAAREGKLVVNVSRALMGNTNERYYVSLGSANHRELAGSGFQILEGGRLSNRTGKALLVRSLLEQRSQASAYDLIEAYKVRTF